MLQHRSSGGRRHPVLLAALLAGALITCASPAGAAPPPPPNPSDAQLGAARSEQVAAAAEVGRIAGLVAQTRSGLERVEVAAEAAGAASMAAEDALHRAQDTADRTAAELAAAGAAVTAVQQRIAQLSRNRYSGSRLAGTAALLDSAGPSELLQRAATLDYVSGNQLRVMAQLQAAKVAQANADAAARQARDTTARARAAAQQAKDDADRAVAAEQVALATTDAQQAAYAQQLQAAQIRLLQLQGARDAYQQWVAAKRAEELAAAAAARRRAGQVAVAAAAARARPAVGSQDYVLPAAGQVSSCFGYRWGALHAGVDLAAPIGTPIYAATSGVVRRAGSATGFGQAVYIEGDDGAVTVYGHVNRYFVSAGDRVSAGQQIAEVGNRGQSTGPHLHFEVHPSGAMYSGAVDPVPWLNARGIQVGGCGG